MSLELEAKNVQVCRKGHLILDGVSFRVRPNTLTAIIGPNGAGKSTLMRALSGERPDGGHVLINGHDLYADPESWLRQIGYVPEDNILHEHLALREALLFIGRLRLPGRDDEEVARRVDKLLEDFGFDPGDARRDKPLRVLSTGERKRANVCSELLIDPPLLMLDEPTSNLDPNAEFELMQLLARYAHTNRKTVLVITHTLNTIEFCDDVIFIENASLGASGEWQPVLAALETKMSGQAHPADSPFLRWARVFDHYKTEPSRRRTCAGALDSTPAHPADAAATSAAASPQSTAPWLHQWRCLIARYTRTRMGDRWSLAGTLLAGLSGVLFFTLPGRTFIMPFDPNELGLGLNQARQSIYVVALVVTLIGLITSYTEVSREYRIYRHERLKGLSPSAYFLSKWLWLSAAVGVLAPLLLLGFIVLVYRQPLPNFPEPRIGETVTWWQELVRFQLVGLFTSPATWLILITLVLACITSVSLGLLISVLAGDGGKGYVYLSFSVVFIVLFSGLVRNERLEALIDTLSFASTGKWAYEGMASSLGIYCWLDSWRFDEFNSTGHLASVWLALGIFILVMTTLSILILRVRDPWYGRTANLQRLLAVEGFRIIVVLAVIILLFSYTLFLRQRSQEYHALNYWSRQEYGGSGAYEYGHISDVADPSAWQEWNGRISQSWCGLDR